MNKYAYNSRLLKPIEIIENNINRSNPPSIVFIIEKITHQITAKLLTKQLFFNLFEIQHSYSQKKNC